MIGPVPHMLPIRATRGRQRHGFTLLEVMLAIVIVGILAAAAKPSMTRIIHSLRLRSGTTQLKKTLMTAKVRAVADPNVHCGVHFDTTTQKTKIFFDNGATFDSYDVGDETHMAGPIMPLGVTFQDSNLTGSIVLFRGDGSARKSGVIKVTNAIGKVKIIDVLASTGRIKVISP